MAHGYIIGHVNVTDPEQYQAYVKLSTAAMQKHGAKILVRGGSQTVVEGTMPARTVVLQFPGFAEAQAFYDSPEYREARAARANAADMQMLCVEGVD